MSDVKWIKLSTQMFDDEKIRLVEGMPEADTILVIWVKLLAQAGKTNASGFIYLSENIPYTDEMLSTIFNRPLNVVRLALNTLSQLGMIGIDKNQFIAINNWEKHQNAAGLDKIREQTRLRVAKHREQRELASPTKDVTLHVTHGNATELELELELDKESNKCAVSVSSDDKFEEWWNLYNNKKGRAKCLPRYKTKLKTYAHELIMAGTESYFRHRKHLASMNEFVPNQMNPYTFLNGEHFNDEYGSVTQEITQKPKAFKLVMEDD